MSSIYDWSTTAASNASSDAAINWAEGQAPSTVNNSARQMMGRLAEWVKDQGGALVAGGTANALTITANSAFSSYATGQMLAFKASADNTGAATLSVNAVGAREIRKFTPAGEAALEAGDIKQNGIFGVRFDAAANSGAGAWVLQNPLPTTSFSTTLLAPATGTASSLAYSFTGDTDTGIFQNGGDNLAIAAGGNTVANFNNVAATFQTDVYLGNAASDVVYFEQSATSAPGVGNSTVGAAIINGGLRLSSMAATTAAISANVNGDGTIVTFREAGVQEGTISVSGATVAYNTFLGAHWSMLADGSKPDIPVGTVVETIDQMANWGPNDTNFHLPCFKISDVAASTRVYGVFRNWENDPEYLDIADASIAALGAFMVRVAAGAALSGGELLESNGDGCARVQADGIFRASTIAKVTSTTVIETYSDGSYLVPCTLHCG